MDTIIFDVDDTVYDQTLPFKKAFKQLFEGSFTEEVLEKIYIASRKYSDELFEKERAGEVSLLELQTYRITAACEDFDIPITYDKAVKFQEVYLSEQQKIVLYDEIEELLERLHWQGKQLAVLTNGDSSHQAMKIKQLNLTRWIPEEHIFISGSLGHAKPAPEVFQIIEEKLQLDKTKTVYIGDSFENDIIGAKQAGWQAIWTNHRKREEPTSPYQADKVVDHPQELLDLFGE